MVLAACGPEIGNKWSSWPWVHTCVWAVPGLGFGEGKARGWAGGRVPQAELQRRAPCCPVTLCVVSPCCGDTGGELGRFRACRSELQGHGVRDGPRHLCHLQCSQGRCSGLCVPREDPSCPAFRHSRCTAPILCGPHSAIWKPVSLHPGSPPTSARALSRHLPRGCGDVPGCSVAPSGRRQGKPRAWGLTEPGGWGRGLPAHCSLASARLLNVPLRVLAHWEPICRRGGPVLCLRPGPQQELVSRAAPGGASGRPGGSTLPAAFRTREGWAPTRPEELTGGLRLGVRNHFRNIHFKAICTTAFYFQATVRRGDWS